MTSGIVAASFEIQETRRNGWLRVSVAGELDVGSAAAFEERLEELRAAGVNVRLDLSKLEFMDSTGLQALVNAADRARSDGCRLEIEPALSPQVSRLFELVAPNRSIPGLDSSLR